jgi:hypothetical protein
MLRCAFSIPSVLEITCVSNLLRSLLLTISLSFTLPVLLVGSILAVLSGIAYLPGIALVGQIGFHGVISFLTDFGNGYPLQGIFIIGATCGMVGGAFDMFNFYFYQSVKNH